MSLFAELAIEQSQLSYKAPKQKHRQTGIQSKYTQTRRPRNCVTAVGTQPSTGTRQTANSSKAKHDARIDYARDATRCGRISSRKTSKNIWRN